MFKRRLLCIILSIILGITSILQTFPVFATENSVVTESLSLYIQMMQKGEDNFEKNGSAEYVSGLQIDDCVLIDLEWISSKLGLLVEITEIKKNENFVSEDMSYDIKKYQEGQEKVFSKSNNGKVILIRKSENNYLPFILKTNSEKAYIYSPYLGEIIVDLGGKVIEQNGKIYVPFTMFLNLFDSYYILDEENMINLYPCEKTVVDIMHTTGLMDYYFDVIEDSGLSKLGLGVGSGYNEFYRKVKALFQGVVNLDVDTLMKSMPSDKTVVSELLSKMLFTNSSDEFEEVANIAVINSNLGFLATDFIKLQIEKGTQISLDETIRKWSEEREHRIQSTGFTSRDEAMEFERQAREDIAREESIKNNIETQCKKFTLGVNLANIAFSGFVQYITSVSEMNSAEIFYVDAVKEYINGYNELQYPFMEKSIIDSIEEKAKLYEKKEKNALKNNELMNEILETIVNTTTSLALDDLANYSAEQIATAYPSFKLAEFSETWLALKFVSVGWDIAELVVDGITNGSLEALDALHTSLYAMVLQTDAYNTLRSMGNYHDLDEYRKLEWVRLRSYYITRQLILMFYQPQQLLHPEEYEIAMTSIIEECDKLVELMTVLAVGPTGVSQEKLDEVSKMRAELDVELLEVIEANENMLTKEDAELIWNEFLKTGNYTVYTKNQDVSSLEYVIADINLDKIPELLIQSTIDAPFFNTWIFALKNKEIVLVSEIYGYGQFRYSQNQNLVIGSPEWKPFGGTGYSPFYKLIDTKLEGVFSIIQDEGIFYYSDSAGKKEINEDERKQFFSDVSYFEWESIQTLTSNVDSQNKMLEVANKYAVAMTEGWDMYQLNDAGLNYVCAYYTNEQIGYTYMDIDGNGVEELIIGSIDSKGYIIDMYTLVDDEIKQVLSSMERDGYYLSSDGSIINNGSGSAIQTGFRRYTIDSDGYTLKLVEGVVYDGYYAEEIGLVNDTSECSEDNSYFKFGSDEKYIHISAQEAQQRRNIFMDKANYMDLECIPFSEYQ